MVGSRYVHTCVGLVSPDGWFQVRTYMCGISVYITYCVCLSTSVLTLQSRFKQCLMVVFWTADS